MFIHERGTSIRRELFDMALRPSPSYPGEGSCDIFGFRGCEFMCEYLVGSLRSHRLASEPIKRDLKAEAERRGYHIQLDAEIPSSIRGEIGKIVRHEPPATLLNITTGPTWNCIDETLSRELEYFSKKPPGDVPILQLIRRVFDIAQPSEAVLVLVDGAEVGWFPLARRRTTLRAFLSLLHEYHDRRDFDVHGVYDITL